MKIKATARSVLHFVLNIFSLSLSYFRNYLTILKYLRGYKIMLIFFLRLNRPGMQQTTKQDFKSGNEVKLALC
jgi:hypothetical protein